MSPEVVRPVRSGPAASRPRTSTWSTPGPACEKPHSGPERAQGRRRHDRDVEVAREHDGLPGSARPVDEGRARAELGVREPLVVAVARRVEVPDDRGATVLERNRRAWQIRRSRAHLSRANAEAEPSSLAIRSRNPAG